MMKRWGLVECGGGGWVLYTDHVARVRQWQETADEWRREMRDAEADGKMQEAHAERYRKAARALVEDMEAVLSHDGLPESDALRAARDALGEGE